MQRPVRVKSAVFASGQRLPDYPEQRTSSDRPGWSGSCQNRKWRIHVTQRKSRPKAALNSNLMIADHATINAGFAFRRYVMKPMPAKPRIIIAQVDGSGTEETFTVPGLNSSEKPGLFKRKVGSILMNGSIEADCLSGPASV
jgi:hypothetical protein